MLKTIRILFIFFVCFNISASVNSNTETDPGKGKKEIKKKTKKIVLIPGLDSHGIGEHEHLGGCQLLAKLLNENVKGVYAVVTEQGWPKDTTILEDADAIVMYSDGGDRHMVIPHLQHIDRLMKKGIGLTNLHYAVEVPKGTAGNYFLDWAGAYFETFWSINPFWTAKFRSFPKHPVSSGVKPFDARDEWYFHMRFREGMQGITPLLSVLPPVSTLDRKDGPHDNNEFVRKAVANGEPQVLSWTYNRPNGGRGFSFTGAHLHSNWKIDSFRKLVLNGIVWTAKINVPKNGIETPTPTQAELDAHQKKPKS